MARFFAGGFDVGPPNVRRVGEGLGGGLGSAGSAVAARAIARAIRRAIERLDEDALVRARDPASDLKRLVPLLKELTERDLYAFPWPQDNLNRDVHGQEGYTLLYTNDVQVCGGTNGLFSWAGIGINHPPPVCLQRSPIRNTMAEVSDAFEFKFYAQAAHILIVGTPWEFYGKTGTPGPAHKDLPMPLAIPANVPQKVVTGFNPWTVAPGQLPAPINRQIRTGKIIIFADEIAEQTEPDAEARSRSPGQNITQPRVRTRTDVQVQTGAPVVRTPRDTFPENLPRTKEAKVIGSIAAGSKLGRLLNATTESLDVFNVAYQALEAKCKPRGRTSQLQRIQSVITNVDCIDVDKLIEGLIVNEIEDKLIGAIAGGAARESARATGGFRGLILSQIGSV